MKVAPKIFTLIVACCLCSCTLTLNPLILDENLVYDQNLEGDWGNENALWKVRAYGREDGFFFIDTEMTDQPDGNFQAKLGQIDGVRFLEISPKRPQSIHQKSFYGGHFLSLYSFWKISVDKDNLELVPMSVQWLESRIKSKQIEIKYEMTEKGIPVITATSKDLQAFISKYANDPHAFPNTDDVQGLNFSRKIAE